MADMPKPVIPPKFIAPGGGFASRFVGRKSSGGSAPAGPSNTHSLEMPARTDFAYHQAGVATTSGNEIRIDMDLIAEATVGGAGAQLFLVFKDDDIELRLAENAGGWDLVMGIRQVGTGNITATWDVSGLFAIDTKASIVVTASVGGTDTFTLSWDGADQGAPTVSGNISAMSNTANDLLIGASGTVASPTNGFAGRVDNIRIYDDVAGNTLLYEYTFPGDLTDSSGNGYDLTAGGNAALGDTF